jgi:hypothetical protein
MEEYHLQFFSSDHLPENLAEVVRPFQALAALVTVTLGASPERSACLRKLLEAKDCAVRAKVLDAQDTQS